MIAKKSGFTLIELVIGVTILIFGLVAVFSLALFAIRLNQENMHRLVALELAREGVEAIRNIRDSNWQNNYPYLGGGGNLWGTSLSDNATVIVSPSLDGTAPWLIQDVDLTNNQKEDYRLFEEKVGEMTVLTNLPTPGATSTPSQFYRYIKIETVPNRDLTLEDAVQVTAVVTWLENGLEKKVEVVNILTNWKKI